jgi:hypothetical protein
MRPPKVVAGFVSFTEVAAGEHRSYNEWHLFDHLPEQLPLRGIAWGERWVLTPALRAWSGAQPPLDRVHYVTLYLLAEPVQETIAEFFALAEELRAVDRFHQHRTSHLSGPAAVTSATAAPRVLVSGAAIPYRPSTGVHVRVEPVTAPPIAAELAAHPSVAGVWTFTGDEISAPATAGLRFTWCWLDGDLDETATALAAVSGRPGTQFSATLAPVDPGGPWDWFDDEG